jgi:hypothetical protein
MNSREIIFTQSARKHRIGRAHALWVIKNSKPVKVAAPEGIIKADRFTWVGFDQRGVELEIIGVDLEESILIIHVMPAKFRRGKNGQGSEG